MTARLAEGRAAWSEYRVLRRFTGFTLLEVRIGTGRTHQIRVHLASIKHPVVGDTLYGAAAQPELGRYFLHAHRIEFQQPTTGEGDCRGVPACAGVGSVAAEVVAGRITFGGIRPPRFPPASISPGGFLPAYHLDDSAWLCSGWCGD